MNPSRLKKHTVLTLTVRSASVYARVNSVDAKGRQEVYQSHIEQVFLNKINSPEDYKKKIEQTIKVVVSDITQKVRQENGTEIDFVAVFYSSPWFISEFRTFTLSPEQPEIFTKDTMEKILLESAQNLKKESQEDDSLKPIEQHISNISLNGYNISDPYEKEYLTANVSLLTTWVSHEFQKSILSSVRTACQHTNVFHFSFPYALITTFDIDDEVRFCVLDVHGEITDIIFIKDGIVEEIKSIPVGTNHLLKAMNDKSFASEDSKQAFISQIKKRYLDPASIEQERNVCEEEVLRWYQTLMDVPSFNNTDDYIILSEEPFRFLFKRCLEQEKGIVSLADDEEQESHIFKQTDIFWSKYTSLHPEHIHRLQK